MTVARVAARANVIAAALSAARRRSELYHFIGYVTGYCDNGDCSVREVDIRLKEADGETMASAGWRCPACGAPLNLHGVESLDERTEADELDARRSVAAQLYARRHPGEAIPIGIILDLDDKLLTG